MDEVLSRNYQYLFIKAVRSATCTPLALATDTGATIDRSQGLKTIALSTLSILPPPGVSFPRKEKTITGLQENAARCTRAAIQISFHITALSPIVIIPIKNLLALCNKLHCRVVLLLPLDLSVKPMPSGASHLA